MQGLAELTVGFFQPQDFLNLFEQTAEYHLFQALNTLAKKDALPVQKGLPLRKQSFQRSFRKNGRSQSYGRSIPEMRLPYCAVEKLTSRKSCTEFTTAWFDARPDTKYNYPYCTRTANRSIPSILSLVIKV